MCSHSCLSSLHTWQAFSDSSERGGDPPPSPLLCTGLCCLLRRKARAGRVEFQTSLPHCRWDGISHPHPTPVPILASTLVGGEGDMGTMFWCQNKVPEVRFCSLCCGGGGGVIIIYSQFALPGCTLPGPLSREAGSLELQWPRGSCEFWVISLYFI